MNVCNTNIVRVLGVVGGLLFGVGSWAAPLVRNSGFELDPLPISPGYGTISDWIGEGGIATGYGLNDE